MDAYNTVIRFFQEGGQFMYPIALVMVVGLVIALERWLFLSSTGRANRKAAKIVQAGLATGDYQVLIKGAEKTKAPLLRVLASGVSRLKDAHRREDVEYAMEESIMEVMLRLEKRTQYLATLANIATLLGLLGTIIGLIAAFTAVANADPAEKANLLSQSISVAMNTTAFGLMTAIPLSIFHAVLQTKTSEIVDSLEVAGIKLLNMLSYKSKTDPEAAGSRG
ncbi:MULTISPECIES: MotA/TolQ/ExbB proton channel family protein [Corallincola]|uniref:MotA/TolQ/ExbB proton channel family protein n=3 Tax=Corallincola TaxID=1775176 RepID=A0A368NKV8_9GAMM|nr:MULTISPECIES: MotA/TolQ/ExbB proton channel family protein [Corallincola]RCU50049.1 MotA/TolQ/ExbB proton channel family protein [Corallincola holothuriorum]TAA44969.1 MotA/TolQ/ExbB proton channel family protein [Corallincola spongiicola]TCI03771.1 MotA/TolQ/ExbB proton channel family protein [Corallincola luteus]